MGWSGGESDALVVATAIELRADRFLTTDAGWPGFGLPVEVVGSETAWRPRVIPD